MEVYHDINEVQEIRNAIVTAGSYDGVHKGHQKILHRLNEIKSVSGGETVVITYWPHPRTIVSEDKVAPKILYTLRERIEILKKFSIDHLLIINFTKEFSQMSPEEYVQKILLERIRTKRIIIGYDHRFGKNREGGIEFLISHKKRFGFEVEEIPREDVENIGISSSKIRKALLEGDILTANNYLGMSFHIQGKVVKGDQIGRKIGYPTANIQVADNDKLIPKDGVYAVRTIVKGNSFNGMLNIGFRPTVGGTRKVIEVNIFDFDEEIYEEEVEVVFIQWLREETKFNSLDALKAQLAIDKENARKILNDL